MRYSALKSFFLISFLILTMTSCARNPVTGKQELTLVSEKREISIGKEQYIPYQQIYGGRYLLDPNLDKYVQETGLKLAAVSDRPKLPYEFVIVNSSMPNAWALPGGKIAITRGLLLEIESEDELAAVLSHEIVHAAARHTAQNMERNFILSAGLLGLTSPFQANDEFDLIVGIIGAGANLASMQYSKKAELEADKYGMKYMHRADYNPEAAISLQEKFMALTKDEKPNFFDELFSTHPPSKERRKANIATLKKLPHKDYISNSFLHKSMIAYLKEKKPAYDYLHLGYQALAENDPHRTIVFCEKGISIEPKESHLYLLKGKALARLEEDKQALYAFNQAVRLNNRFFDNYLQRGLLKMSMGDKLGATKDLEMSLYLLPTAEAHHALGFMKFNSNQTKEAIQHYKLAASVNSPGGKLAQEKLQEIFTPSSRNKDIEIIPTLTDRGYLVLKIYNKGIVTLKNVVVDIDQLDPQGQLLFRNLLRIDDDLAPNQEYIKKTSLGPFYSMTHLEKSLAIAPVYSEVDGLERE